MNTNQLTAAIREALDHKNAALYLSSTSAINGRKAKFYALLKNIQNALRMPEHAAILSAYNSADTFGMQCDWGMDAKKLQAALAAIEPQAVV